VKNASENFSGINERPFTYNLQERSSFRLHPLRPDGTGVSDGCITFYHREDFNKLRRDLLRANKQKVPGSQLEAYGIITVSDNRYDKY
ncbi:tlde1 domain-containing protein, partial [Citrobacter amalonaticus]